MQEENLRQMEEKFIPGLKLQEVVLKSKSKNNTTSYFYTLLHKKRQKKIGYPANCIVICIVVY